MSKDRHGLTAWLRSRARRYRREACVRHRRHVARAVVKRIAARHATCRFAEAMLLRLADLMPLAERLGRYGEAVWLLRLLEWSVQVPPVPTPALGLGGHPLV